MNKKSFQNGVTLIELIITIAIIGIISLVISQIAIIPISAYNKINKRVELSNQISKTANTIKKDIRNSLPNSIRITQGVGTVFIEFIPIKTAGRYREFLTDTGIGNVLDFTVADSSFDILSPSLIFNSGDRVVIENLNLPGFNVYNHDNSSLIVSPIGIPTQIVHIQSKLFPTPSHSNIFYVIGNPITYYCNTINGEFRKFINYDIQINQPNNISEAPLQSASNGLMGRNFTRCNFQYIEGDNTRNGIFTIEIENTSNNEKVSLFTQFSILNY